jgi:hypothetical protein
MRRRHTHLSLDLTLSLIFSALLAAWVATELFAFSVHFPTALGAHYSRTCTLRGRSLSGGVGGTRTTPPS